MGRPAAGIACFADTTGRLLLLRRSPEVKNPGLWSIPAGGVHRREKPVQGAIREFREETGYDGPMIIYKKPVLVRGGSRKFHVYAAQCPTQFRPRLNWENDAAIWVGSGPLPSPLHPGALDVLERLHPW